MDPSFSHVLLLSRISACVALRDETALRRELKGSIGEGVSLLLIREAILQSYLFAGYAAAINAFIVLNELAPGEPSFLREEKGVLDEWRKRGEELCRVIYADQYSNLVKNINRLHPDLAEWMVWEGYGKVLSRPFLSTRVRELLIVAVTAVLNVERQFHSHVRGALHTGATAEELRAVFVSVAPFMEEPVVHRLRNVLEALI